MNKFLKNDLFPTTPLLAGIFDNIKDVGIIAIIVLFQQEMRRFLLLVGKNASLQRNKAWWQYLFGKADSEKITWHL